MAQNRINKAGSIFTSKDRPLWYDIYKAFPPKRDPLYRTILAGYEKPSLPSKIFYAEDEIRAYYGKYLWPRSKASYLNATQVKPVSEIFVQAYVELAKKGISKENLVRATMEELKMKGIEVEFLDERREQQLDAKSEEESEATIDAPAESMSPDDKKLFHELTQAGLKSDSPLDDVK